MKHAGISSFAKATAKNLTPTSGASSSPTSSPPAQGRSGVAAGTTNKDDPKMNSAAGGGPTSTSGSTSTSGNNTNINKIMSKQEALGRLGLNPLSNPSEDQIRKAYRQLALQKHPDKHPERERRAATKEFQLLNKAKDIALGNEEPDVERDMQDFYDLFGQYMQSRTAQGPHGPYVFSYFDPKMPPMGAKSAYRNFDKVFWDLFYGEEASEELRARYERQRQIREEANRISQKQHMELNLRYERRRYEEQQKQESEELKKRAEVEKQKKTARQKEEEQKVEKQKLKNLKEQERQLLKKNRAKLRKLVREKCGKNFFGGKTNEECEKKVGEKLLMKFCDLFFVYLESMRRSEVEKWKRGEIKSLSCSHSEAVVQPAAGGPEGRGQAFLEGGKTVEGQEETTTPGGGNKKNGEQTTTTADVKIHEKAAGAPISVTVACACAPACDKKWTFTKQENSNAWVTSCGRVWENKEGKTVAEAQALFRWLTSAGAAREFCSAGAEKTTPSSSEAAGPSEEVVVEIKGAKENDHREKEAKLKDTPVTLFPEGFVMPDSFEVQDDAVDLGPGGENETAKKQGEQDHGHVPRVEAEERKTADLEESKPQAEKEREDPDEEQDLIRAPSSEVFHSPATETRSSCNDAPSPAASQRDTVKDSSSPDAGSSCTTAAVDDVVLSVSGASGRVPDKASDAKNDASNNPDPVPVPPSSVPASSPRQEVYAPSEEAPTAAGACAGKGAEVTKVPLLSATRAKNSSTTKRDEEVVKAHDQTDHAGPKNSVLDATELHQGGAAQEREGPNIKDMKPSTAGAAAAPTPKVTAPEDVDHEQTLRPATSAVEQEPGKTIPSSSPAQKQKCAPDEQNETAKEQSRTEKTGADASMHSSTRSARPSGQQATTPTPPPPPVGAVAADDVSASPPSSPTTSNRKTSAPTTSSPLTSQNSLLLEAQIQLKLGLFQIIEEQLCLCIQDVETNLSKDAEVVGEELYRILDYCVRSGEESVDYVREADQKLHEQEKEEMKNDVEVEVVHDQEHHHPRNSSSASSSGSTSACGTSSSSSSSSANNSSASDSENVFVGEDESETKNAPQKNKQGREEHIARAGEHRLKLVEEKIRQVVLEKWMLPKEKIESLFFKIQQLEQGLMC
ncbi:unnamed protein product [Amoebophrya sp. A120]|nr:unnamed protein product [Amoebophrya sp. A120]|eukprot:GSA120T00016411001.1